MNARSGPLWLSQALFLNITLEHDCAQEFRFIEFLVKILEFLGIILSFLVENVLSFALLKEILNSQGNLLIKMPRSRAPPVFYL